MMEIWGVKQKELTWKKWITKKMQAVSIEYHKFWRKFKLKKYKNNEDWKEMKKKRRYRNKIMKQYKLEWLAKKFNEKGINGKEGWQIAAEVRDLHIDKGRELPNIQTSEGIAVTTKEKAEALLEHYHRYDRQESIEW